MTDPARTVDAEQVEEVIAELDFCGEGPVPGPMVDRVWMINRLRALLPPPPLAEKVEKCPNAQIEGPGWAISYSGVSQNALYYGDIPEAVRLAATALVEALQSMPLPLVIAPGRYRTEYGRMVVIAWKLQNGTWEGILERGHGTRPVIARWDTFGRYLDGGVGVRGLDIIGPWEDADDARP